MRRFCASASSFSALLVPAIAFTTAFAPSCLQIISRGRTIAASITASAVGHHAQSAKTTAGPGPLPSHRSHHHPFSSTKLALCLTLPHRLSLGGSCGAFRGGTRGRSSSDDNARARGPLCCSHRLETALLAEALLSLCRSCGICCNLFLPAQFLNRDRRNFKLNLLCCLVEILHRERNFADVDTVRKPASFRPLVAA